MAKTFLSPGRREVPPSPPLTAAAVPGTQWGTFVPALSVPNPTTTNQSCPGGRRRRRVPKRRFPSLLGYELSPPLPIAVSLQCIPGNGREIPGKRGEHRENSSAKIFLPPFPGNKFLVDSAADGRRSVSWSPRQWGGGERGEERDDKNAVFSMAIPTENFT